MTGILILLTLSCMLLKRFDKNWHPANLLPKKTAAPEMLVGFLWPLFYFFVFELWMAWVVENPYRLNQEYSSQNFIHTFTYIFRSIVFEELLFRGALLYLP
jgi:membrane protease YdiL (CAAX protease family)